MFAHSDACLLQVCALLVALHSLSHQVHLEGPKGHTKDTLDRGVMMTVECGIVGFDGADL